MGISCYARFFVAYLSSSHLRVGPWGFGLHTVNCSFHPYGELSLADVETIFQVGDDVNDDDHHHHDDDDDDVNDEVSSSRRGQPC